MKKSCVELFSGAGGLSLGLEKAGFEHRLMVERDDDAFETVRVNSRRGGPTWDWPIKHADVRDVQYKGFGEVDLVAGGPPCQPFSIAGKHRGHKDPRDMWPEAIRAVRELAPKAFLFENVRGLARPAFAEYLRYIIERLKRPAMVCRKGELASDHLKRLARLNDNEGEGPLFSVQVHKVNAANFGAAQIRHRLVIIGVRRDLDIWHERPNETHSRDALLWAQHCGGEYWEKHGLRHGLRSRLNDADKAHVARIVERPRESPWVTVRDAISNLGEPSMNGGTDIPNHRFQPGARCYVGHTGSPLDQPAKALKAGDHGVPGGENMLARQDGSVRYFTVRESARLQGFPDDFVFPGSWTESMRQLGNAVPVPLAKAMGCYLAELLRCSERSKVRRTAA